MGTADVTHMANSGRAAALTAVFFPIMKIKGDPVRVRMSTGSSQCLGLAGIALLESHCNSPGDTDTPTLNQQIIPSLWGEIRARSSHENPTVFSIARISLPILPQKPQSFAASAFERSLSSVLSH